MESSNPNLNASYRIFARNGEQTMFAIEVHVPVPYNKIEDDSYIEQFSNNLYPLVKRVNNNQKVDKITLIFHAQKYIGAFPIYKTKKYLGN